MIGIIGFGRFSALMAKHLSRDCDVKICTRKNKQVQIAALGAKQVSMEEVCAMPYVILSVPISAMKELLKQVSPLLPDNTVVSDVCSVKTYPIKWMRELLPDTVSILPTHPMFGPDSAADSLSGRKIVLCRERIEDVLYRRIKDYLSGKGLILIETTPEEHDRQIATSLSLTHFVGRSLSAFGAKKLDIDTEGYARLLHILGVVENDTWELFKDMHHYNPYAEAARSEFMASMAKINDMLNSSFEKDKL